MRINGDVNKISGVYNKSKNLGKIEKTESIASKKDILSISKGGKDFQTAMKALRDIPDIRHERVSSIQEKYDKGEYDVEQQRFGG